MDERLKQQIASRFTIIATVGQNNMSVRADKLQIRTTREHSRTRAEVSSIGSYLKVNPSFFPSKEVERRVITYIHEAAHLGMSYGTHHKPKFWEQVATITNNIISSETNKRAVESFFSESIDWEKVKYRTVQDVAEPSVDGRIETVEERKRKLAEAIGYGESTAEEFELTRFSWAAGDPDTIYYDDPYSESVKRDEWPSTASEYTDADFRTLIDEYGIVHENGHISFEAPLTYMNGPHREFVDYEYASLLCAFADRTGMDYCPMTTVEAVVDDVLEREVTKEKERICERYASAEA